MLLCGGRLVGRLDKPLLHVSVGQVPVECKPLLIDEPKPLRVSIVTLFRDGRMIGLRPTAMLFKEPAMKPFSTLPGRELPRER